MPMRYEITAPETRNQKSIRLTGEIGTLVAFCLIGLALTMFFATHMPGATQFLVG
jgi:hypothetical protein